MMRMNMRIIRIAISVIRMNSCISIAPIDSDFIGSML